jgi:hypothetical protein
LRRDGRDDRGNRLVEEVVAPRFRGPCHFSGVAISWSQGISIVLPSNDLLLAGAGTPRSVACHVMIWCVS